MEDLSQYENYQLAKALESIATELGWSRPFFDRADPPWNSKRVKDLVDEAERILVQIKVRNDLP